MKNKHLQIISIAFATSLFTLSSCVDNDYDLAEDIDFTIQVGGSEFAIPGGETEPIELSKILKVEEGDLVKINPDNGNYYLLQTGKRSDMEGIRVDQFEIVEPFIPALHPQVSFYYPGVEMPDVELDVPLPEQETEIELSAQLPTEVKSISNARVDINGRIMFSFQQGIISKLNLKDIKIQFPKSIKAPELTDGVLKVVNQPIFNGGTVVVSVNIQDITLDETNTVEENGIIFIRLKDKITLNGVIGANPNLLFDKNPGEKSIELTAGITLNNIQVRAITGVVKPDIKIDVDPITLNGLPEFLSDQDVVLDVKNPMIFFTANNQTPIAASVNGRLTSVYKDRDDVSVPFTFGNNTIKADLAFDQIFCLSMFEPDAENTKPGTQWIPVPNLPSLINKIPDEIQIKINVAATDDETTIPLGQNFSISTDYEVNVPFAFGENMTIVYKDTLDGWNEDIKDYEVEQIHMTGTVENKIPLNIELSADAVGVPDANGNLPVLSDIKVIVKVDNKENGIIPAGDIENGTNKPIVIEITAKSGSIKKLDGLLLNIHANSKDVINGRLNKKQTFQLKNVKLKVPGGIKMDLN